MVRVLKLGKPPRHPGVLRGVRGVEPFDGGVVRLEEVRIARHLLEPLARHEPQHADGVVRRRAPELIVELAEHLARRVLPAPPEIGGELVEPADTFGKWWKTCVPSHRTTDRSRPCSSASMNAATIVPQRRRSRRDPSGRDEAADPADHDRRAVRRATARRRRPPVLRAAGRP